MRVHVCSEDRQELLLACAMASRSERMWCAAWRQQAGVGAGGARGGSGETQMQLWDRLVAVPSC